MTVLYVLISTDPFGGATKSFMTLLRGVLQAGVKAVVVVPDTDGIYATLKQTGAEIIVQYEKGCTWTGMKNLKQAFLYVPRQIGRMVVNYMARCSLEKKLKGIEIDLVHSNNSVASLGSHIADRRNLPHLYHIREYGDKDFGLRYFPSNASFHRHLKEKGIYTVCITKDIQRHHGLADWPSSRVIYNGIIQEEANAFFPHAERNFFLYAGRIEPTKGLLTLIKAYKSYCERLSDETPLPLKVAGDVTDPEYMCAVEDCISTNNIKESIIFLGRVDNMAKLYQEAKAIIIPSEHEGFGRCMPEAMSYGCIAIANNTGGSKEQFDNGLAFTGGEIGFRYHNTEELTERLLTTHSLEESELTSMQQRAYRCVCSLYSVQTYVHSVLDFYNFIINDKQ